MLDVEVQKNAAAHRFEAVADGAVVGIADYVISDGVMVLPHTEVPPQFGGQGIAGKLARAALNDAREQQLRVNPACSYIAVWIDKHPEYADLLA